VIILGYIEFASPTISEMNSAMNVDDTFEDQTGSIHHLMCKINAHIEKQTRYTVCVILSLLYSNRNRR
jgi:hypothetical protein